MPSLGLRLGLGGLGGRLGGAGKPLVLRAVSTRGEMPGGSAIASTSSLVCLQSRTKHTITDDVPYIQVIFGGYYVGLSATFSGELTVGNDQSIEIAIEIGGTVVQANYSGQLVGTIVNGVAEYISDPILASAFSLSNFTRGTVYWIRQRRLVSVGQSYSIAGGVPSITGERTILNDGSSSQLLNTGALVTTGATILGQSALPLNVIGPVTKNLSVLGLGDSIMSGASDNNEDGGVNGGGFFPRALNSVGGRQVAYGRISRSSSQLYDLGNGSITRRATQFKYYSNAFIFAGTNDPVIGSHTAAQVLAALSSVSALLRARGIKRVEYGLIVPRAGTTDAGATLANQTPVAGFETGGNFRDVVNTAVVLNPATYGIDDFLSFNSIWADATSLDKWIVNGTASYFTSDCIHPRVNPSVLGGAALNARAATWTES